MKDYAKLAAHHTSEAAAKRTKKRNAAQIRLKLYGIAALCFAALALVSLLSTVIGNAAGAVREHYVTLPVTLSADDINAEDINKADFGGITKEALRDYFSSVKARGDKKLLYDVVSSGAPFELREMVIEDPSLIGTTPEFRFLASDVTDLYLKGEYGSLRSLSHEDALTIVEIDEKTLSFTTARDVFTKVDAEIADELSARARRVEQKARQEQNGVRVFRERLLSATDEAQKAEFAAEVEIRQAKLDTLLAEASELNALAQRPFYEGKLDKFMPSPMIKIGEGWAKITELSATGGQAQIVMPIDAQAGVIAASDWSLQLNDVAEVSRKISDKQIVWIETLRSEGRVSSNFNWRFLSSGDSREPEVAGIWGAIVGSALTMLVTFFVAFPIGVLTAIYLEEFAPRNKFTDFVEVNINNLAAVPSIVFGLLGLAFFLTGIPIPFTGITLGGFVPRSVPVAGGLVLALMSLPTIIIASRASIRAVPPSIRDAALGLGASKLQTSFHHVLPLAMPGVLTGSIIAMAQALGETAPLIMIGMVAFIVDIPEGFFDTATVLPVQVFRWADLPERAFEAKTAAAICVLLIFLVLMNALAVFLRKRFERRW